MLCSVVLFCIVVLRMKGRVVLSRFVLCCCAIIGSVVLSCFVLCYKRLCCAQHNEIRDYARLVNLTIWYIIVQCVVRYVLCCAVRVVLCCCMCCATTLISPSLVCHCVVPKLRP